MVLVVVGVDEEVVHINDEPAFSNHIPERVRHESLESGRGIGHAEEHDSGFVESSVGNEGGFPLVAFLDSDVVISPSYIKLGEDLGVFEFVNEIGDQGEGVGISDSVFVKVAEILAGSEASILFLDEEERRSLGGFGRTDFPGVKVFVNKLICGFPFLDQEGTEFSYLWDKGFIKVYSMVIGSRWGYMVSGLL